MNIIFDIPEDLQTHIKAQIRSGVYSNAAEYFLDLGQQDCQRQRNLSKIEHLLKESPNYSQYGSVNSQLAVKTAATQPKSAKAN
jgi:Arc/MetJ-type ribon-helix-helix transcriptional regulator